MPGFHLNSGVTEAEILWAIQTVLTHSSLHSCDDLSKLLGCKVLHPEKDLLILNSNLPIFLTCYDESLNRVFQEEQMDVVLRYFNNESESCLVILAPVILILLF